jgi:outer membrane protein assembly factor BamD
MRTFFYIVVVFGTLIALSGCALFGRTDRQPSARELAEDGMKAYNKKNYKESIDAFEKLRDWYPFSQYAVLAELKLGDAYYQRKEYEQAIFAYEEFENLHPKNEAVPYVIYQIGRCYFDRLQTIDRDQTMATEAARTFERLVNIYPESPFAAKAHDHIRIGRKNLAEHEFYVGAFYLKAKYYKAAQERFKTVLRDYPDLGVHYKAIQYLARCQNKMEMLALENE